MAPQLEKAHTCKLPSRKGAPFLRFICPDWSKLDIIGQTIVLAELVPHFGSFQNVCAALKLHSNEVESFVTTHLQYQQASERGRLIAEQWGRDQAVPAGDDADIPQQRPMLLYPSSIAPACHFLEAMGYREHAQAVRAWNQRIITWPPHIDATNLNTARLDQSDITFPAPRKQKAYSRYFGSLGNDSRSMFGFVGAWQPKEYGSPDTRISFINVPEGSVAFGPRGSRELIDPGRYSVCWRTASLSDNEYHDFVLARNTPDDSEDGNGRSTQPEPIGYRDANEGWKAQLETSNSDQGPTVADATLPASSTVNPKAIFGTSTPDTYNSEDRNTGPFHRRDEPQGPSKKLENRHLQQTWSSWSGPIFQFRLPRGYTILGPLGHILTFDPPEHEKYDETGNPHGIGGTYFIVPFQKTNKAMSFKMDDLPANVSFRLKTAENLVFIRNGMVLPGFVEPGVHEWSTRDGRLDFYNARGFYDIFHTESCYNILPKFDQSGYNEEHREQGQHAAGNPSPIREAFKTLAPHRVWLERQEAKTKQLEHELQERAQLAARNAREKARRDIIIEERQSRQQALEAREAQEQARVDAIVLEDTAVSQGVKNRRGRRKQSSSYHVDPILSAAPEVNSQPGDTEQQEQWPIGSTNAAEPDTSVQDKAPSRRGRPAGATRRKRVDDDEDDDYQPTTSRPTRARKPRSAQKPPTPRKSQAQPANDVDGIENPQPAPVPQNRRTRATASPSQVGERSADAGTGQSSATSTRNPPRRATPKRKPIGPLLEAIRGASAAEGSSDKLPDLSTVPKVNDEETTIGAADDSGGAIGGN
ncbi:hypothetical protein F4782DRAFT_61307 [Xylaria castorea]|nr:hypothetical protein F4782DRAFT_61307 [Xylaria castorea]